MTIHDSVQRQFGAVAAAYATSAVHAAGPDLVALAAAAAASGAARALDIACGAGHTALAIAAHVAEVTALDLTEAMLEQARRLAVESLATFEQLNEWAQRNARSPAEANAVAFALAEMLRLAGEPQRAVPIAARLAEDSPRNGHFQRLHALLLTELLGDSQEAARVAEARAAWERLLRDDALRSRAPQRYWEARYHMLELLLREGRAADVEQAIRNERAFFPEMGGRPWSGLFNELYERAARLSPPPAPLP